MKDNELLEFASSLNFQFFVKDFLKGCMEMVRSGDTYIMQKWGKKHE